MDFHSNLGLSLFRRLTEDKLTFIGRNSGYMERVGRERVEDRFVKKKKKRDIVRTYESLKQ